MAGGTPVDHFYPFEVGHGDPASSSRWRQLIGSISADGVVTGYLNQLAPTLTDATHVSVNTGAMVINGAWAEINTAQVIPITQPGSVVMRITIATLTISIEWDNTIVVGPYPQNSTFYEVPICSVSGGVLTDLRPFVTKGVGAIGPPGPANTPYVDTVAKQEASVVKGGFARTGIASGCLVTQHSTINMTVDVAAGVVLIAGVPTTVPALASLAISAAHATLNRIDVISVDNTGVPVVTPGTPAAVPTWPVVAAIANFTAACLATVYVAANAGSIPNGIITDKREVFGSTDRIVTAVDGATITFDVSQGNTQQVVLGGSRTLAVANDATVNRFTVILGTGTGAFVPVWWSGIRWVGGAAPTVTVAANKYDVFSFLRLSAGVYLGFVVGQAL